MQKIEIFVRHCNLSSHSIGRKRLPSFSRELCYHNLKRTSKTDLVNITFMMDGDEKKHFLKDEKDHEVIKIKGGTEAKSFQNLVEYVNKRDFSDETIIYLLEDDYFHKDNWPDILLEGFEISADYISLYDHKDKYCSPEYIKWTSKIFISKSCHWRTTPTTTNTYAMKFKTFKQHFDIHKKFSDLKTGSSKDHNKFLHLWNNGYNLFTSIPGYSTHMDNMWLSPTIDWEKLLIKEKNILENKEK